MNFRLNIFYLLAVFILLSTGTRAQTETVKKELLIQTDELKSFRVFRISQQLSAIDGVHFWGYISKTQTLLITYEEAKIMDWSIIITSLAHFNKGMCLEILENETIFVSIDKSEKEVKKEIMSKEVFHDFDYEY